MENFEFQNPTRIIFGRGELDRAGLETRRYARKVLLVTGMGSVKRSGVFRQVADSLERAGVEFVELQGVRSNPVISGVREGIRLVREERAQAIMALGGGSVMDTGKAVAAGACLRDGDPWDFFTGSRVIQEALPVIAIPTLAASGSEMNGYMVITDEESGHKLAVGSPFIYPRVSILDPSVTFSVPGDYTAYGGVDAVCHLLEPYFNGPAPFTPVQDRLVEGLISVILEATPASIRKPDDYNARAALMWSATLALCGLTKAGVGTHYFPVHLMEHALSAIFHVPHGAGLAALLPGWMTWRSETHPGKIARLGRRVWGLEAKDDAALSHKTVDALRQWLGEIGCPKSLRDLGITGKDYRRIANNASFQASIWGIEQDYGVETMVTILGYCA